MKSNAVIKLNGVYTVEHIRNGVTLSKKDHLNGVTNIGKDTILNVMFGAASQLTPWYLSFISLAGYTALAAADTMSSHAGWVEFTGYSEATRPEWTEGAAASQVVTNAVAISFNINATGTIKGGFLTSENTKSGTTGILWGTALFSGDLSVTSGDIIKITYSVTAA